MNKLSGADYELLACEIIESLQSDGHLSSFRVGSGPRNRLRGASGYMHQIDLSLRSEKELFLLELKYLCKPVGVAELLVLAARKSDIEAATSPVPVYASLVTSKKPSRNVPVLAAHVGIQIEFIQDMSTYALGFNRDRFVGHVERTQATDTVSATFTPNNGA